MKRAALCLTLAACCAWAEKPEDFTARASIEITAADALQRIALPAAAYRHARADLGDIRIFNGRGEPVPMAFAGEAEPTRSKPPGTALPLFPVTTHPKASTLPAEIRIRAADGTLVSIHGKPKARDPATVAAYYVDATAMKDPIRALELDWNAGPGTQVINVSVEASDDLRSWSPVAGAAPLVRIEHAGQVLGQRRVELSPRRAKYLRITPSTPIELRALQAFPEERIQEPELARERVRATPGEEPGEFLFDLGARLPVESVRLVPVERNTVMSGRLSTREEDKPREWRTLTRISVYRLTRDGADFESPAMAVPRRAARYWRLQLDAGSFGAAVAPPELEVRWRPAHVVFVARGEPPFTLAMGKPDARAAVLPVSTFIPQYERLAELELPEARLGEVKSSGERSAWRDWIAVDANRRKLVLWLVLGFGVALLAYMAWRLHGQLQARNAAPK